VSYVANVSAIFLPLLNPLTDLYNQSSAKLMLNTGSSDDIPGRSMSAGEIYVEMKRRLEQGASAAMATVVKTRGSTPQQVGAKMVIFDDGSFIGTVGGGCVEADIWAEARDVLRTGTADVYHFNLNDDYAEAEGMVCGGQMDVLIERWAPEE
jgi:xanthine dehydrogenase accessory factor